MTISGMECALEKIHLEADFLPASFLADGHSRARAVCRIRTASSFGTGFLITPNILMTNNHVIETRAVGANSVAEFDFEDGNQTRTIALAPRRLFITDERLDFTIIACEESLDDIEPIPLLRNPSLVTRHERVNVIQHPSARAKEIAIHDNRVERIMTEVIRYRTDTEPGSSGSPVFNNEWDLVALHHAGFNQPGGKAMNEGIRISAIVSHLLSRSGRESAEREAVGQILDVVQGTASSLGFFETAGLIDSGQEVVVDSLQGT